MTNYINFFGFQNEPFPQDISLKHIFPRPGLKSLVDRFLYAVNLSAVNVITGDVGSGKSTSLRFACSKLHPSEYKIIPVIANSGSLLEMLRQIAGALKVDCLSTSITKLSKIIRSIILETADKKQKPVLVVDEAHLMRLEVFAQIHTIFEFEFDSRPVIAIVLAGQKNLTANLKYHTSGSLASRVVGISMLDSLRMEDMKAYLKHQLEIAGVKESLFADEAVLAIHQGSGGLLRKANTLARGALLAAASESCTVVAAEHVRRASTEII